MGNRAVICFDEYNDEAIGIYLHWNGGRDSVESFLEATRRVMGDRLGDEQYNRARLMQVIGTAIPGNLSFGLAQCKNLDTDNYDNGTYVVDSATMTITQRLFYSGPEQNEYDVNEFATVIVEAIKAGEAVRSPK